MSTTLGNLCVPLQVLTLLEARSVDKKLKHMFKNILFVSKNLPEIRVNLNRFVSVWKKRFIKEFPIRLETLNGSAQEFASQVLRWFPASALEHNYVNEETNVLKKLELVAQKISAYVVSLKILNDSLRVFQFNFGEDLDKNTTKLDMSCRLSAERYLN
jgi:hypothetical protein